MKIWNTHLLFITFWSGLMRFKFLNAPESLASCLLCWWVSHSFDASKLVLGESNLESEFNVRKCLTSTFSCLQNLQPGIQLLPRPHRDLRHIQSKVNQFNIYVFIQKLPFLVPCVSPYLHHLWWTTLKENWKRLLKRYLERSTYLSEDKWESTWTLTHSEKLSWLIFEIKF